jgi:hypothetical protein
VDGLYNLEAAALFWLRVEDTLGIVLVVDDLVSDLVIGLEGRVVSEGRKSTFLVIANGCFGRGSVAFFVWIMRFVARAFGCF